MAQWPTHRFASLSSRCVLCSGIAAARFVSKTKAWISAAFPIVAATTAAKTTAVIRCSTVIISVIITSVYKDSIYHLDKWSNCEPKNQSKAGLLNLFYKQEAQCCLF